MMKKIKILLAIFILPFYVLAQKVDVAKDGTVTVDGKPEFKIEGKMGMVSTAFTITNLEGKVLMNADGSNESNVMVVTFPGSNSSFDYPLTIGLRKVFAKDIARMKVIQNGALSPDGMKRMIAKYNGRADRDVVLTDRNTQNTVVVQNGTGAVVYNDGNSNRPVLVQRNKKANVFINNGKISQDFKTLGHIKSKKEASSGTVMTYFDITDVNGNFVASASKAMNSRTIEIVTFDKNRLEVQASSTNLNDFALEKFIVESLISSGHL
ncbi:MAG TPA: hypothetical protein PKX92_08315 [Edaphocola sp.]|nr:hypothetical protein [Edaphocola sp.]